MWSYGQTYCASLFILAHDLSLICYLMNKTHPSALLFSIDHHLPVISTQTVRGDLQENLGYLIAENPHIDLEGIPGIETPGQSSGIS